MRKILAIVLTLLLVTACTESQELHLSDSRERASQSRVQDDDLPTPREAARYLRNEFPNLGELFTTSDVVNLMNAACSDLDSGYTIEELILTAVTEVGPYAPDDVYEGLGAVLGVGVVLVCPRHQIAIDDAINDLEDF